MIFVKAMRYNLEQEAAEQEGAGTQCIGWVGRDKCASQPLVVTGAEHSVVDLQYLLAEGTESSV